MSDNPVSPSHYKNATWEAIDVIEDVVCSVCENGSPKAAYSVGASLKYLTRAGRKGNTLEQLKKAEWHLRRAINLLVEGEKSDSLLR